MNMNSNVSQHGAADPTAGATNSRGQQISEGASNQSLSELEKIAKIGELLRKGKPDETNNGNNSRQGDARRSPEDEGQSSAGGSLFQPASRDHDGQQTPHEGSEQREETPRADEESQQALEGSEPGEGLEREGETLSDPAEIDGNSRSIYDEEVTTREGEVITVGALKDAYQDQARIRQEIVEKDVALSGREAALASDIQALGLLDAMQAVPQHIRTQAAQQMNQMAEREYSKFLAISPDLQNDVNRIAFENDARKYLGAFGVSPEQFGVKTLGMHRLLADAVKTKKQLAELTRPRAQTPPKSVKRGRVAPKVDNSAQAIVNAAKGGSTAEKTAAIAALIGGRNK